MSSMLTVKLRRDLRASWSRFLLMVIAIAVSLTALGSVLFAWAASGRETTGAYASTEPASATIVLVDDIPAERMAAIAAEVRTRAGVIEATGRTQFNSEVEVNGAPRALPLQVFVAAPDDAMRMARFDVSGATTWPPAADEILLSGDSLALLDVAVGDVMTIKVPSGERVQLRVAGAAYDPSLSPSPQEQRGHGYVSTAAVVRPGEQPLLDQLKLQVAEPGQTVATRDRNTAVAAAGAVGEWLQRDQGLVVREIQVPPPYAHPHQWQADALLGSLLAGGAASLLLSTILVANVLNGLFTQQIPQIGIMKAVGARTAHIIRLYLAMTLVVAVAATLLAVAPAILLGQFQVYEFLRFLGIQPVSLAAPWWTYIVLLAVGFGLPPLMALLPLLRTSGTTVRAAIDHHGGGSNPSAATGFLAGLSRVSNVDRGVLMALRNTVRRPARFVLSVGLVASAGTVFVAGMSLSSDTQAVEEEQKDQRTWDVEVQLAGPARLDQITSTLAQVPHVSRIDGWSRTQTGVAGPGRIPLTRTYPDQGHGGVSLSTFFASNQAQPPKLLEGRWLEPGESGAVVLNQITRDTMVPDARAGDSVQLFIAGQPTTWRVAGIVEERGHTGVYTTDEGYGDATGQPGRVNQLRIVTDRHDEETRVAVADATEKTLTQAGIAVSSSASVSRSEAVSEGHLGPVILILLGVALPLGVIGGIGLTTTMGANILDRTREFGIMHAIGARPKRVRRIVTAEGVFIALASLFIAAIPTLGLTAVLGAGLGNLFMGAPLPYRISIVAVGIWSAIAILGSVLATEAAATRASRLTVREALAYL
jgi:putative ABC transport system permease protein